MTIVLQTMSIDKKPPKPSLVRLGSSAPITSEKLDWDTIEDAAVYFRSQRLSEISVLHHLEIDSCLSLMEKLKLTRRELADLIEPLLY